MGSLEVELASDLVVSVPRSAGLLTEVQARDASKRLWQLSLTGKSQVELDVRQMASSSEHGLGQLAQVLAVQEITPDKVKANFLFQIEVLRHPVRELVFDCDPQLSPYDVSLPIEPGGAEVLNWRMDNDGRMLIVELRQAFQGTLAGLQVRCLATRLADQTWTSPFLRLAGTRTAQGAVLRQALTRGEKLKLLVHPDVPLQKWEAGSFRLLSSDRSSPGKKLEGDGVLILSLEDPRTMDGRGSPVPQRRPSFVGKAQGIDLHTQQRTWWHLGPQGMTLDSEITYEMARGGLYQLLVRLPKTGKGWRVEKVDVTPADMLQSYSSTEQMLTVDLRSGVTPRSPVKLTLQLRSLWDTPGRPSATLLDFPDLEPFHAAIREGTFHIDVAPIFQASVVKHSVPAVAPDQDGPWGTPPAFSFQFRDLTVNPQTLQPSVTGKLRLVPSSDRLQVYSKTKVVLTADRATVQTRLDLDPLTGSLDQCDFMVARGGKAVWQARFEKASGRSVWLERRRFEEKLPYLLGLGQPSPLTWLPLVEAAENLQIWRLRFSPPLTQRETILLETELAPGNWWDVPLPCVLDTPRRQSEVLLEPSGTVLGQVQAHGLVMPEKDTPASLELRRLPVDAALLPMLRLQTKPAEALLARQEHIDHARLQSYLLEDGRVFHHFSFQAANWAGKEITVLLPGGSRVVGARVAGLWQDDVTEPRHDDVPVKSAGVKVRLPVPLGRAYQTDVRTLEDVNVLWPMDVYYTSESSRSNWSSWDHVEAPWPTLPVAPLTRQRTWCLAPGLVPLRQDLWRSALLPAGTGAPARNLVRKTWQLGDPLLDYFSSRTSEDVRQLRDAEIDLRKKWATTFTLGEALERLTFEHLKDRALFVIDAAGLAAVDLRPDTPIGKAALLPEQPFWESLGLTTVPCPTGIVLTTRQQWNVWKEIMSPRDLDPAVLQALTCGRDRQGLLQTVSTWLHSGPLAYDGVESANARRMPSGPEGFPHSLFGGQVPTGWTLWTPHSHGDEPAFDVIRTSDLRRLTYMLGAAALLLTWRAWQSLTGIVFFRVLLLWSTVWALAFVWLPTSLQTVALGPLLSGAFLALLAYAVMVARGVPRLTRRGLSTQTMVKGPGSSVGPLGMLLLLVLCMPLTAQNGPAAKTPSNLVLVILGPADAPEKGTALINPDFLKKLKDQTSPAAPRRSRPRLARLSIRDTSKAT